MNGKGTDFVITTFNILFIEIFTNVIVIITIEIFYTVIFSF